MDEWQQLNCWQCDNLQYDIDTRLHICHRTDKTFNNKSEIYSKTECKFWNR